MAAPRIILYTNHLCPFAQRAHIALKELGLQYEEVIIDLEKPREPWYLEINPRGLVPTISYNGTIIPESAIVAQLLADAHPSHLLPPSNTPEGAIKRAQISFFVDSYTSKVLPVVWASHRAGTPEEKSALAEDLVQAIEKNKLEAQLYPEGSGSGPFFHGSEKLTLAEVLTGSFLLRLLSLHKPEYGLLAPELPSLLEQRVPKFLKWAQAVIQHKSVNHLWNEKLAGEKAVARLKSKH
ncbi:glutathione S-transferase family protein [Aspergillus lucknowensis]|uniref:Thioredoxin-like protein n=1 Tax=Aspergillus lucknowensis TaxID=176173 RepID=A0ABR4LL02_9EURO